VGEIFRTCADRLWG